MSEHFYQNIKDRKFVTIMRRSTVKVGRWNLFFAAHTLRNKLTAPVSASSACAALVWGLLLHLLASAAAADAASVACAVCAAGAFAEGASAADASVEGASVAAASVAAASVVAASVAAASVRSSSFASRVAGQHLRRDARLTLAPMSPFIKNLKTKRLADFDLKEEQVQTKLLCYYY